MQSLEPNMEFVFVYVATYVFVALFCAVILSRVSSDVGRQLEVRYFRFEMATLILYCLLESIWAVGNFGLSDAINRFNVALSVVNHILVCALCYFWFCYMESYLHSRIANRREWRLVAAIPFVLSALLSISTLWNGLVFSVGPDGSAQRGSLYLVTVVIAYGYASIATIRALHAATKAENRPRRSELVTMSLFVIPPAAVGVIDTLIPLMPIVAPAFFFSFLIVFTMLLESQISTDQLTGLNNRRRADKHFAELLDTLSAHDRCILFMIDGNKFKAINDNYGHLEGDNALCIIANALRDACRNSGAFIARWGGDEFVIMVREEDINSPEDFINLIEDCLLYESYERGLPYKLAVSVGYAYFTSNGQSRRQVLEEADRVLYEAKAKLN